MSKSTEDRLKDALIEYLTPRIGETLKFSHVGLDPKINALINEMQSINPKFKLKYALETLPGYKRDDYDLHTFTYVPPGSSVSNSAAASSVGYGGNSSAVAANAGFTFSSPSYAALLELRKNKLTSLITGYLEKQPYGDKILLKDLYDDSDIKPVLNEITKMDETFNKKALRELIIEIPGTLPLDHESFFYKLPNALGIQREVFGRNSSPASAASSASSVNVGGDEILPATMGGRRLRRKSRKSRKGRKSRKSRKGRKATRRRSA